MGKMKEQVDAETGEIAPSRPDPNLPALTPQQIAAAPATLPEAKPFQAMPITPFGKLAEAIAKITEEVAENPIKKEGKNAFHNYSYARMQDILNGLTPMMAKNGVVIMQTEVERGFMDNGNAIFATYDFTIMHKSGEVWPFPQRQTGVSNTRTSKGTFDDKGLNKCHTSARKYFLLSLFQIPTTDEDDADRGDNDRGGRREPIKPAAKDQMIGPRAGPVEKRAPHEIPRPAGIKAVEWGRSYVEQIKLCETVAEVDAWAKANEKPLVDLAKMASQVFDRVTDVEKTRREELEQATQ